MTDATEEVPFNAHLTELIEQRLPAHAIEGLTIIDEAGKYPCLLFSNVLLDYGPEC